MSTLKLTPDEQTWLDAYRQALKEQYPDMVERMVIYGSKARGDDHPDSDLDVLLIVKNDASHLKRPLRRIGYELAATSDAVPSILAYTQDEWESRRDSGAPFQQAVERDAVAVL
jgi:predicted nucleotidyltransferase